MICRALNCQRWGVARLALLSTLNAPPSAASPIYSLTEIGDFGGDTFAWGINNSGQVSGYSYDTSVGQNRAFLFSVGVTTNLGTSGGTSSTAYGLNDAGQVAGSIVDGPQQYRTTIWSNGATLNLGTLGGPWGAALDINNFGQVTGASTTSTTFTAVDYEAHAFFYTNGLMTDLGTLGGPNSEGRAIPSGSSVRRGVADHPKGPFRRRNEPCPLSFLHPLSINITTEGFEVENWHGRPFRNNINDKDSRKC